MKNSVKLIFLFAIAALTWSCNETPKKVNDTKKEVVKSRKTEKKNINDQLLDELKNTKPVNVADLETWIPKTLGGLSLDRTKSVSVFKEAQMSGWYKKKGDKMIILTVTDAAGPNASMFAEKISVYGKEPEYDVEGMQFKSVKIKGRMASQAYDPKKNMVDIKFFHERRFLIKITTFDYGIDETWNLVDELDFEMLSGFSR